jgi:hypothetical protein
MPEENKTPDSVQTAGLSVGAGSEQWCWSERDDAEIWHEGGKSREEAIARAKHDATLGPQPDGFWIAPTIPATRADVDEWWGDEEIVVGSPIIDCDRIEHFPPNRRS